MLGVDVVDVGVLDPTYRCQRQRLRGVGKA